MAPRTLLDSLRRGGHILYVRHAEATVGIDQQNITFLDCSTQRNLSAKGRRQAAIFGETIRRLAIPITLPIISSPFCRTIETAARAFGADNILIDLFWVDVYRLSGNVSVPEQARILTMVHFVLETPPPSGRNRVIIAHSFPTGVGLGEIPDMGTIVVKPQGRGRGFNVVDHLTLEELVDLSP